MGVKFGRFGAGQATIGSLGAGILPRRRHHHRRQSAGGRSRPATGTSASPYAQDVQAYAESLHTLGCCLPLSDVIIEPRFLPPPVVQPDAEDEHFDNYRVVPIIHDHPFLHAACALDTLTIEDLEGGSRALALLGLPGSGRSTALAAIALYSLNALTFEAPPDPVQRKLDSADEALSEKDRAVRIRERVLMQQRARERMALEDGAEADADDAEARQQLFRRLMPVLVHLRDVLPFALPGSESDPAEPLVRAMQHTLRPATARAIPATLYQRLAAGSCLVLIDGFDELLPAEQAQTLDWLRAFHELYRQNTLIVTGPVTGCDSLLGLGLTAVHIAPWSRQQQQLAAARLSAALTAQARSPHPQDAASPVIDGLTALHPEELVWRTLAATSQRAAELAAWPRAAIERLLPRRASLDALLPDLAQLAAVQLDEGRIRPERLVPAEAEASAREPSAAHKLLDSLCDSGLLRRHRDGSSAFAQPRLAAWLASLWLSDADPEERASRESRAGWSLCAEYLPMHISPAARVNMRLAEPADILGECVLGMARWLAFAPSSATWRGSVMKRLSLMVLAPNQYPLLRERAAAALLDTRDPAAALIFRRAARSTSADVRRIGCLGLGALGGAEAVSDLRALLDDQQEEVRLSACIGLGAAGGDDALDGLVLMLTQGSEPLRQLAAEALSRDIDAGLPILHEAVQHDDMLLRRAAIFGLRRLRTTWALIEVYRAFLEDDQWYVRSAAQQAFHERQHGRTPSPTAPQAPLYTLDWFTAWAEQRGVAPGDAPATERALLRLLREGTPGERRLAAQTLGSYDIAHGASALYTALRDPDEAVRAAAYSALGEVQRRTGIALPGPG